MASLTARDHQRTCGEIGAEPGVDPRRASAELQYGHIQSECAIEITDYSSVSIAVGKMRNMQFIQLMCDDAASERPPWVKVRWINIGGVSWDVIKALSQRYGTYAFQRVILRS
jgi:hypothetical protein